MLAVDYPFFDYSFSTHCVDVTSLFVVLVFLSTFLLTASNFFLHFRRWLGGEENLQYLGECAAPLAEISCTFSMLVYSYSIVYTSTRAKQLVKQQVSKHSSFFSFIGDSKVSFMDMFCAFVGLVGVLSFSLSTLLWLMGLLIDKSFLRVMKPATRLMSLLITKSYLSQQHAAKTSKDDTMMASTMTQRLFAMADINHDGSLELVDVLASVFSSVFSCSLLSCYISFMRSTQGSFSIHSWTTISSLWTIIVSTLFACNLSKRMADGAAPERNSAATVLFCLLYIALLVRTLSELSEDYEISFYHEVSSLGNGLVMPITHLLTAALMNSVNG
jgi:hypothetical protein